MSMSKPTSTVPIRERDADNDDVEAPAPAAQAAGSLAATQPAAMSRGVAQELDLVFACDCTGSMGAYLRSAQENIRAIAQKIHDKKGQECSIRFALVKYRDHPPQDSTFVTETYPFTKSLEVMKANVDTMFAQGGGDGPEAVTAALKELVELEWRANASKVCVFIADAPPHGLGESGDGFPNGDPNGTDPIAMCRALAAKGVTVYAIGVEPVLSTQYKFARDFMITMAKITDGKFLPLGKADILGDVIVSTAIEGLEMESLWTKLEEEIKSKAAAANEQLTADQLCARVETALAAKKHEVVMQKVQVENPYMNDAYDMVNCEALTNATSLSAARSRMSASANAQVASMSAGYQWAQQKAICDDFSAMDEDQCMRFASKAKKKSSSK